jgi:hypothetical protein
MNASTAFIQPPCSPLAALLRHANNRLSQQLFRNCSDNSIADAAIYTLPLTADLRVARLAGVGGRHASPSIARASAGEAMVAPRLFKVLAAWVTSSALVLASTPLDM